MMGEEEQDFWLWQDPKFVELLEQRVPALDVWIEDVGQWVRWGPDPILEQEGPPLDPIREELMEVKDGATLVQKDGAMMEEENSIAAEQATWPA